MLMPVYLRPFFNIFSRCPKNHSILWRHFLTTPLICSLHPAHPLGDPHSQAHRLSERCPRSLGSWRQAAHSLGCACSALAALVAIVTCQWCPPGRLGHWCSCSGMFSPYYLMQRCLAGIQPLSVLHLCYWEQVTKTKQRDWYVAISHRWLSAEAMREMAPGLEVLSVVMGCASHPTFSFPKQRAQSLAWLHEWGWFLTCEHPPHVSASAEPLKRPLEVGRRAQPSSPPPLLSLWF